MKNLRKIMAVLLALLMVLALSACAKSASIPAGKTTVGVKDGETLGQGKTTFTVEVTDAEGAKTSFTVKTDAENLGAALVEDKEIGVTGEDSDYGIFITTVDGEAASNEEQTFWSISKDGVDLEVGADSQPIADGEHYELTLKTW